MDCCSNICYDVLHRLPIDARLLFLAKFLRLFAFGFLALTLIQYLTTFIGLTTEQVGTVFSFTLLSDALVSLIFTSNADLYGRRVVLISSSILSVITGAIFATQTNYLIIMIAAIVGMISPSGQEVGPFMAVEISSLSCVDSGIDRTRLLAYYNLCGSFATAIGALTCGCLTDYLSEHYSTTTSYKIVMLIYATIQITCTYIFYSLSPQIEAPEEKKIATEKNPITLFLGLHRSKLVVCQLSLLFMIDSFAGSFVFQSFISEWFSIVYSTPASMMGFVLFVCNIVAGISALFAAKLAETVGLILTMIITHVPSNILLILVPLMPSETLSMLLIVLRFRISQMDVPTRNSYVIGVVCEDERSGASGVITIVRSLGASIGPSIAGKLLMYPSTANSIFYVSGTLKLIYDFLLLLSFNAVKPDVEMTVEKGGHEDATSDNRRSERALSKWTSNELTPIMKA